MSFWFVGLLVLVFVCFVCWVFGVWFVVFVFGVVMLVCWFDGCWSLVFVLLVVVFCFLGFCFCVCELFLVDWCLCLFGVGLWLLGLVLFCGVWCFP